MNHLKTYESFFGLFGKIDPDKELAKFKQMEHDIEFPKEFDPYLFGYYVSSLGKIIKYAKKHDASILDEIDINNSLRLFGIVRNKQKLLPSTIEDLENYYNEYKNLKPE